MEILHIGLKTARLRTRMESIFGAIDSCVENKALFPALILIYASIDFLGSLRNKNGRASGSCFKSWAKVYLKDYLLKVQNPPLTVDELWQARNGIVHTQRYDSIDGQTLGIRQIIYSIGFWDEEVKRKGNDYSKYVGVHVDDLFFALKDGFYSFQKRIESSSNKVIDENLDKLPDYIDLIPLKN